MLKRLFFALLALLILGGLLALDLANRGLAWQFFWSQTGEETPVAQLQGMVEWVGNLTRVQPINDALIPVNHANLNPYGINTFLHQEVEAVKVEEQLRLISAAGFKWIREEFAWEDIEIHARGDFDDRRNVHIHGVVDAWAKYDRLVDLVTQYDIQIQARISNPPAWSQAPNVHTQTPPLDFDDYVRFAETLARRYQGRISYYQIWNEPNIFPEWGADADGAPLPVDPVAYTDLLCRTYAALKAIDPEIVVISGALAPTSELWDVNLNDFVYLQRMYDAGAGACFDVLSMQGYGLNSGATDRRMRPTTVNVGRNQYIRQIMVENGDAHKPIWISEAAWNPVPSEAEAPNIANRLAFGQVTQAQAAAYMPQLFARARQEWAWVGVMNYWYFTQPTDARSGESWYYFRMAEPDYSDEKPTYTTLPVYEAMRAYITEQTPTLYHGVHQLDTHWAVDYPAAVDVVRVPDAQFDKAVATTELEFVAYGTAVRLRWQGEAVRVWVDGELVQTVAGAADTWQSKLIHQTRLPAAHTIRLEADAPVLFDSVMVIDRQFENVYLPLGTALACLLALTLTAIVGWFQAR